MMRALLPLMLSLCACAAAGGDTIDFGPGFGGPATGTGVLTNQLAAHGVTFSTTDPDGVIWYGGDYSYDPARYAIAAGFPGVVDETALIDPIRIDFAFEVIEVCIRAFDGGGDVDTTQLRAYSADDTLLDMHEISDEYDVPGLVSTVSSPGIAYVIVEVTTPGEFRHGVYFDDLTFTIPAPASGIALAAGFLALPRRRR